MSTIVYSTVYSDADQREHQSLASLAFVRGSHRRPVNSLHKWPVTQKMFPFDDVIMQIVLSTGNSNFLEITPSRCVHPTQVAIMPMRSEGVRFWILWYYLCLVFPQAHAQTFYQFRFNFSKVVFFSWVLWKIRRIVGYYDCSKYDEKYQRLLWLRVWVYIHNCQLCGKYEPVLIIA